MSELGGNRNRGVRVAGRRFHTRVGEPGMHETVPMYSNPRQELPASGGQGSDAGFLPLALS